MKKVRPNKMRRLRRQLDLSQGELATMLNTYQVRVSRWEREEIKVPKAVKEQIAKILDFPVEVIFPSGQGVANEKHRKG